jgi:hypothetical protein
MKKLPIFLALASALAGCVYPFSLDVSKDVTGLVVDGDILIGDTARVELSSLQPLKGVRSGEGVTGTVWIEDDKGDRYEDPVNPHGSSFAIDMTTAPADRKYRIGIKLDSPVKGSSSVSYHSSWQDVQKAPKIDSVYYTYDDKDLDVKLSLSTAGGNGCFRWDYDEIWEFHTALYAYAEYRYNDGIYLFSDLYGGKNPYYWCWSYSASHEAGIAIARSTGGERIIGHDVLRIPRSSKKIQSMYYIKVKARNISEECYEYLRAIQENSNSTGSLMAPDPSQVVGNVRSDTDPLEVVYGYVGASQVAFKEMFIGNALYRKAYESYDTIIPNANSIPVLNHYYDIGFRPYYSEDEGENYYWVTDRCVDCTRAGGTKDKPSWWPTNNQ